LFAGIIAALLMVPAVMIGFVTQQRRIYRMLGRRLRPLLRSVRRNAAPALDAAVTRAYRTALVRLRDTGLREDCRRVLRLGSRLLGLLDAGIGHDAAQRAGLRRDVQAALEQAFVLAARVQSLDELLAGFDRRRASDRLALVERAIDGSVSALEGAQLAAEQQSLEHDFERSAQDERLRAAAAGRLLELLGRLEELAARLTAQRPFRAEPMRELTGALESFSDELEARCEAVEQLAPPPLPLERLAGALVTPLAERALAASAQELAAPWAPALQAASQPGAGGRYRTLGEIGRGGVAVVYLAEDLVLGRQVAIKTVSAAGHGVAVYRERLQHELDAAQRLDDPRVVQVYELFEEGDRLSLVMEYVAGPDLKRLLALRGGRLSAEEVLHAGREALAALAAAHRLGIVHGDVKPHNLLRAPDGQIKLADFGMARLESELGAATGSLVVGTPEYAAPEILGGDPLDHRADIYGLGVTLYELATGRLPYGGRSPFELLHAQAEADALPPRDLVPGIPELLERAICRAMEKDPEERFQSAEEMLAALEAGGARALLRVTEPEAAELCLLCQAENAAGSAICWSCGAPPASMPRGEAMLAVHAGSGGKPVEIWQKLARFSGTHTLPELARHRWALVATRMAEPEAWRLAGELEAMGYRAAVQGWLDPRARRVGPSGQTWYGRLGLALGAAAAVGRLSPLAGWITVPAALAAAALAYRLAPAALARVAGWPAALLAPLFGAQRSLLESPRQLFESRDVLLQPPAEGWTVASWARLHRDVAEIAPEASFRPLAHPSPEILFKSIDANLAASLSPALREQGIGAEVRSVRGRNEDLVTRSVLLVPAGIFNGVVFAAFGAILGRTASAWLGMQSEVLLGTMAVTLALYMAFFSRRLLLRASGLLAGYLRRPLLEAVAVQSSGEPLPRGLGPRYRRLLQSTRGTRLGRQLQRLLRRALRVHGRMGALERAWFGEAVAREALHTLMERGLDVAERARSLDATLAEHPEMELLGESLELERELAAELDAGQRDALQRRLQQVRETLRRYGELDRERRRLGSLLSRVAGALASAEQRLQHAQAAEGPDDAELLRQSLAELEAELQGPHAGLIEPGPSSA
jgi:hypothetical protein